MQVIKTKYFGPTNYHGSRIKAWVPDESPERRESVTLEWDDALNIDDNHNAALQALCAKHDKAFDAKFGSGCCLWAEESFVRGATNDGYAYVRMLEWNVVKGKP